MPNTADAAARRRPICHLRSILSAKHGQQRPERVGDGDDERIEQAGGDVMPLAISSVGTQVAKP